MSSTPIDPRPRNCSFSIDDWTVLASYWYPVAKNDSVGGKPVAVRLLDQDIVLFRTEKGITAAADLCAHRGAPLSLGKLVENGIRCAYHGYCYDSGGKCTSIPAHPSSPIPQRLQLRVFPVRERYGLVWLCLDPKADRQIPNFPEAEQPAFQVINMAPLAWSAASGRQVESFCDVAHFAFVHENTFAVGSPEVPRYSVDATDSGVHADFTSNAGNITDTAAARQDWRRVYEISLPFTACLTIHFPHGGKLAIMNSASPISARKTHVFVVVARDFEKDLPIGDLIEFQQRIYREDQAIVERQCPEDLPIDLNEEVHVRADLTSVTYRRQLGAIGLGRAYTS